MHVLARKPDGQVELERDGKFTEVKMNSLSLLGEMLARPPSYPQTGIPVAELREVLARIESCVEVTDKRLLEISAYHDGYVVMTTGMQIAPLCGGGFKVLLKKTGQDWEIVESCRWIS